MKTGRTNSKLGGMAVLATILTIFFTWGVASAAEFHAGQDCADCHDMTGVSTNVAMILTVIQTNPCVYETSIVDFARSDGQGVCQVCHAYSSHIDPRVGEDCTTCHGSHCADTPDLGDPGMFATSPVPDNEGHDFHTVVDPKHGSAIDCVECHVGDVYKVGEVSGEANFPDIVALGGCAICHSSGGAFDGMDAEYAGNWSHWNDGGGIYADADNLKIGKEKWCVTCHDSDQRDIDDETPPNIAGDNSTYGFYVNGHGTTGTNPFKATLHGQDGPGYECTLCHDLSSNHIGVDDARLEAALTGLNDGLDYTSDTSEVCLDCHLVGQTSGGVGLGLDATAEASVHSGAINDTFNESGIVAFPAYGESGNYVNFPGYQCEECHSVHGTQKLAMVLGAINGNVGDSNLVTVVGFQSTDTDLTDLDPSSIAASDGVCDVCHISSGGAANSHPDSNQDGNHNQGNTGDSCMVCHSHESSFAHAGGGGTGCDDNGCHGHGGDYDGGSGTWEAHSTHTDGLAKGPGAMLCGDCHDTNNYPAFKSGTGTVPYDLSETDVCDACHSPDGAFDGVDDATVGAKNNWDNGVYESNGVTLKAGKEQWCVTCHDDDPANSKQDGSGVNAPKVGGNNSSWGFYATGHGRNNPDPIVECLDCHDATIAHIDGDARTYEVINDNTTSVSVVNPYNDSYRLKDDSMVMPRPLRSAWARQDFALCLGCHWGDEVLGAGDDQWDVSHTNFWDENYTIANVGNDHFYHLKKDVGVRFDSDWDGTQDSRTSCVACHNVHGSSAEAMIRGGELIDHVPALDFTYLVNPSPPVPDPDAKLTGSAGGWMRHDSTSVASTGVCKTCHSEYHARYERDPKLWPKVIPIPGAEPDVVVADGTGSSVITVTILDPDDNVSGVTINLGSLGGSTAMTDNGDGTWSYSLDLSSAPVDSYTFEVTATDYDENTGKHQVSLTVVIEAYEISGQITESAVGLDGITVELTGDLTDSTVTSGGGYYSFTVVDGSYTVTPTGLYDFDPDFTNVNVIGADQPGRDFTATVVPIYEISGQITESAVGLDGITVELTGALTDSTVTSGGGYYSFTVVDGSYTVTPSSVHHMFTPGFMDVTVSAADQLNQDFTAGPPIEVIVDNADPEPEVTYVGGWNVSTGMPDERYGPDALWKYAGSGNAYVTFTPDIPVAGKYKVYAWWTTSTNRATNAPYSINGEEVRVNQRVNGGDWNQLGTGTYSFAAGASGSVVLSDDANGLVIADAVKFQLVSVAATHEISGQITENATGLDGETVELSGDMSASTVTSGGGYYSFTVLDGSYTVTPSSEGYNFTPTSINVTVSEADQLNQDFTAEEIIYVIVDNADPEPEVTYVGGWNVSTGMPDERYGPDALWKYAGSGNAYVTFTPDIPVAGKYKVYAWWTTSTNRATNAPYSINGEEVRVNQRVNGGDWNQLGTGTYSFAAGASGSVVLSDDANGLVIADAVKFQLVSVAATHEISGQITENATGLDGETVELSGDMSASTVTSGGGYYSFTVLDGSYTVTPSSEGYNFTPTSINVTVSEADQLNQDFTAEEIICVIVDNADPEATYVGGWSVSTGMPDERYGADVRYKGAGGGSAYVTWTVSIDTPGDYNVYARWTQHSNRATDAPYTISHVGGPTTVDMNQQQDGGQWKLLGTHSFLMGDYTVILTDDANGYVIADAIKWELQE